MNRTIITLILTIIQACTYVFSNDGVIWINRISTDCVDSIHLINRNRYIYYICELDRSFMGNYQIAKNILILVLKSDLSTEDGSKICYYRYRFQIKDTRMELLSVEEKVRGKWIPILYENNQIFQKQHFTPFGRS